MMLVSTTPEMPQKATPQIFIILTTLTTFYEAMVRSSQGLFSGNVVLGGNCFFVGRENVKNIQKKFVSVLGEEFLP